MIRLQSLLNERKSLYVFDFDDTLARSDAYIYVKKRDGKEIKMDPADYAVYKEEPGDTFDFRDFNKMLKNPRAIKTNIDVEYTGRYFNYLKEKKFLGFIITKEGFYERDYAGWEKISEEKLKSFNFIFKVNKFYHKNSIEIRTSDGKTSIKYFETES